MPRATTSRGAGGGANMEQDQHQEIRGSGEWSGERSGVKSHKFQFARQVISCQSAGQQQEQDLSLARHMCRPDGQVPLRIDFTTTQDWRTRLVSDHRCSYMRCYQVVRAAAVLFPSTPARRVGLPAGTIPGFVPGRTGAAWLRAR